MFIILKTDKSQETSIHDLIYSSDDTLAYNSMNSYAVTQMESLKLSPARKYTKYNNYFVKSTNKSVQLLHKYKQIHPGVIYNTSEYITETLFTLNYLPFDNYNSINSVEPSSEFTFQLNKEIQLRLFKQLNIEQTQSILEKLINGFSTKKYWNNNEIMNLFTDITYEYKISKIESIIKTMKRYGEYPMPYRTQLELKQKQEESKKLK
jgi:hypothetical protein